MVAALMLLAAFSAPPSRTGAVAVELDGKAYILGGMVNVSQEPATRLDVYDFKTKTWATAPAPFPRFFAGAAAYKGRIYMVGGLDEMGNALDLMQSWKPGEADWTSHMPLPSKRSRLTLTAVGQHLVAAGGIEGPDREAKNSAEVNFFDPATGRWTTGTELPESLHGHCAVEVSGDLSILGGYAGDSMSMTDKVHRYAAKENRWMEAPPMPRKRGFFGVAKRTLEGESHSTLWAFGGRQEGAEIVDEWSKMQGAWTITDLKVPQRHRFALVMHQGAAYIFGGEEAETLEPVLFSGP